MQLLFVVSFFLCINSITSIGFIIGKKPENCDPPPPTTPKTECDQGWTVFTRAKGRVCLKVFHEGQMSATTAENLCKSKQATLSGLENQAEAQWIHAQALPFLPASTNRSQVWTGGIRKPECYGPQYAASCSPALTASFIWSDPTVSGLEGWSKWWCRNPDNVALKEFCIELTIQSVPLNLNCITPASINDIACDGSTTAIMGYVCSKKANVIN